MMIGHADIVTIAMTLTLLLVAKVTEVGGCPKCQMCMFPKTMYDVTRPWRMFSKYVFLLYFGWGLFTCLYDCDYDFAPVK